LGQESFALVLARERGFLDSRAHSEYPGDVNQPRFCQHASCPKVPAMKRFVLLALLLTISTAAAASAADAKRPNIVLIMADDFGYECIGANGGTSYKTPVLDKLAATGTRFTHCYSQPLCTPTRVQLMTGIYNVRNYLHFGVLAENQVTFGNLLQNAGYATCIAGKWQLGKAEPLPRKFGFAEHCLWQHSRIPGRYKNPGLEINGQEHDYTKGQYGPDLVSDYALRFVTEHKDKPFLLYYPMILTHSPYDATPKSADWNDNSKAKPNNELKHQHFTDMVEYADLLVGKLVARLDELKIRDNTLILFLGDNGTGTEIRSKMGDRIIPGGKGSANDGGMHVPLIVNCPSIVRAGEVSNNLIDSTDFLPTICEAVGIEVPKALAIDGQSFYSQLRDDKDTSREWIYCWYARNGGAQATHEFARDLNYKLTRGGEFYDVREEDLDKKPLDVAKLDAAGQAARQKLQGVLKRYENARPGEVAKAGQKGKVKE
jgi:arylsulfatase A